jgi:signal transduction histidine kinase
MPLRIPANNAASGPRTDTVATHLCRSRLFGTKVFSTKVFSTNVFGTRVFDTNKPRAGPAAEMKRRIQWYAPVLLAAFLADAAGSVWSPWLGAWAHLLQNGYYIAIASAAIAFGWRGGFIAGAAAAINHVMVMVMVPGGSTVGWGEAAGFISVGLLGGFIAQHVQAAREVDAAQARPINHFSILERAAASIVHEFRTPLASIEGAGFVLEDATLPEEKRQEFIGIILKECQRLDRLVGLLDEAQHELDYRQMNVSSLFDEVISAARTKADAASHPLRKALLPNFPCLTCDSGLVRQIITDLTVNAMNATLPGREIVLSAYSSDDQVFIEVIDQRLGVGEESLDSMLDRSLPNEHWRIQLATARQVAVQHGGAVKVKRNDNSGITTSIVLPVAD